MIYIICNMSVGRSGGRSGGRTGGRAGGRSGGREFKHSPFRIPPYPTNPNPPCSSMFAHLRPNPRPPTNPNPPCSSMFAHLIHAHGTTRGTSGDIWWHPGRKKYEKTIPGPLGPSGRHLVSSGGHPGGPSEAPVRKSMV